MVNTNRVDAWFQRLNGLVRVACAAPARYRLSFGFTEQIIETHRGRLEIVAPKSGQAGLVRISLPLDAPLALKT